MLSVFLLLGPLASTPLGRPAPLASTPLGRPAQLASCALGRPTPRFHSRLRKQALNLNLETKTDKSQDTSQSLIIRSR